MAASQATCLVHLQHLYFACSFVWALVHSPDPAHVERGLDLAQSMINAREIDQQHLNDLVYMCAVVSVLVRDFQLQLPVELTLCNARGDHDLSTLHRLSIEEEATKLQEPRLLSISR